MITQIISGILRKKVEGIDFLIQEPLGSENIWIAPRARVPVGAVDIQQRLGGDIGSGRQLSCQGIEMHQRESGKVLAAAGQSVQAACEPKSQTATRLCIEHGVADVAPAEDIKHFLIYG